MGSKDKLSFVSRTKIFQCKWLMRMYMTLYREIRGKIGDRSLIGHLPREMSRFVKIYLEDTSILAAVVLKIPILPTVKNG